MSSPVSLCTQPIIGCVDFNESLIVHSNSPCLVLSLRTTNSFGRRMTWVTVAVILVSSQAVRTCVTTSKRDALATVLTLAETAIPTDLVVIVQLRPCSYSGPSAFNRPTNKQLCHIQSIIVIIVIIAF